MFKRFLVAAALLFLIILTVYLTRSRTQTKPIAAPNPPVAGERKAVQPAAPAVTSQATIASNTVPHGKSAEFDVTINPYAGALREPGKSKREWDVNFLKTLGDLKTGQPIQFELTDGRIASGTVQIAQFKDGELTYVSGEITRPESGKFFFLKPPDAGKAGKAAGVIEFPGSKTAYRIEPTGPKGDPELWQRRMDEVVCMSMPIAEGAADTNETSNIPPLRPGGVPDYVPSYNSNIVSLQSYPGSSAVLLLDFFGGSTTTWGGVVWPKPNVSNEQIKDLWKRVAEDFMPFNINVTTDIRVYQNAPSTSKQRCVFTPSTSALGSGAAGVAYIGSWNWGSDTVCWSIYYTGKNGSEVGSHEPGHTLGLGHQGTNIGTNHTEYYTGQGSGVTGWAPIMGAGYYQPVTTWSKGEYANASNTGDALTTIANQNNVHYRADDTGSTLATARYLEIYSDSSAFAEGVIEQIGDTDAFQFTTSGGQVALNAKPAGDWASVALSATLADAIDTIIASNNPQNVLNATINTVVPAGTYTFRVTGSGRNDPLTTGFSSYVSHGYYSVAGYIIGASQPTRLSVVERTGNGTAVGTIEAGNPGDVMTYTILSGNSNNTFTIDNNGFVTVANNTLLDYNRLSTNSMYQVGFELLVNITDVSNPALSESNRRVVISVLSTSLNYPIAFTGFNAGIIAAYNASTAAPNATGFDIANNWCFYQAGLFGNPQVGGAGGLQGLPPGGVFLSQSDGATFQLGPYAATNALMMGRGFPNSGTLTFSDPAAYNSLAILASSANGGGLGTVVLTYSNGTQSPPLNFNAQDWYSTTANVGIQGFGRMKLAAATLTTEDPGWNNPNLYHTTLNLAALGINQTIRSLLFTKPSGGVNQDSGVLAVSGSLMPPQVVITKQPQSLTNNNPAAGATLYVVAMGAPALFNQWYSGNPGSGTLLAGQTATNLTFSPVSTNQAGNYFVVVSNAFNVVTSSVATLTVYGAPVITQQPTPTNLWVFTGRTAKFTVSGIGATPLSYYWRFNGATVAGGVSSSYTLNNAQTNNSGDYSVVLSNAFGMVTSSVATLTVQPSPTYPYGQTVLSHNPIGYWRLDEASGSVAYDYAGGNHGTYSNAVLNQLGNNLIDTHRGARFGGVAQNSYVGNIAIDFATNGNAQFSVEAWVNGAGQTTDAGIITKGSGGGGEQFNLDCGGSGHAFRFFVRDATGAARPANGAIVPNSQWHHLVGVCDEAGGKVILYVDGVSNASGTITAGSGLMASAKPVTFGSRQSAATTGYDLQFRGLMEEVAIYNFALSPAQVQEHYAGATNRAPVFTTDPFSQPIIDAGQNISGGIATNAADPNGDVITFGKVSGPSWLAVANNGLLLGTPQNTDAGTNTFILSARDAGGLSNTATMFIYVNGAPAFTNDPITLMPIQPGQPYSGSLSGYASDPNPEDALSFSKTSGPAWLTVASDGTLSGTPAVGDTGTNSIGVRATDPRGLFGTATLMISVAMQQPLISTLTPQGSSLLLSWSGGNGPFQVQMTTNAANPNWQAIAGPMSGTTFAITPTNDVSFYRIVGQ